MLFLVCVCTGSDIVLGYFGLGFGGVELGSWYSSFILPLIGAEGSSVASIGLEERFDFRRIAFTLASAFCISTCVCFWLFHPSSSTIDLHFKT